MELVFATNNKHKLTEIRSSVGNGFNILSLDDIGFVGDIPETQPTLEGNARQKADYIYDRYQMNCFADDTGLEVAALNGAPGVYSARYAGPACSFKDNIKKILHEMKDITDRACRFRTVISLIMEGEELQFEGVIEGEILETERGEDGFGYDSIFKPAGYERSFAEMSLAEKNAISHRGRAVKKLAEYIGRMIPEKSN